MIGLEGDGVKAAQNLVAAVVFTGVAIRYGSWVYRDWPSLKRMALGTLPLSVVLLMCVGALSSGYYGLARILRSTDIDLWGSALAVNALGVLSLFAVGLHMVPVWRSNGLAVRPRIIRCTVLIGLAWGGLSWLLW